MIVDNFTIAALLAIIATTAALFLTSGSSKRH